MSKYEVLNTRIRSHSSSSIENLSPKSTSQNDDEDWHQFPPQTKCQRWLRRITHVANYILIHILIPILVVSVTFHASKSRFERIAQFSELKSYGSDIRYMSLDHKYDFLWEEDLIPGQGSIKLPLDNSLGPADLTEFGNIGMFHSLHCLAMFRKTLQAAHYGDQRPVLDHEGDPHWPHCMYHVRQAILCQADPTIELPRFNNGTIGAPNVSGVTDVRHCRSSESMIKLRDRLAVWDDGSGKGSGSHRIGKDGKPEMYVAQHTKGGSS